MLLSQSALHLILVKDTPIFIYSRTVQIQGLCLSFILVFTRMSNLGRHDTQHNDIQLKNG
jgi:hypothetical protein